MIRNILAFIEGNMPRYGSVFWNKYEVKLFATETDVLRIFPLIPYYWDSDIALDLVVNKPKRGIGSDAPQIDYAWDLLDIDDKRVKGGNGVYVFDRKSRTGEGYGILGRKHKAIKLGYLKPYQCYKLNLILTDNHGIKSDPILIASFAIKDRDEVFTQILVALVVIIMGIIIGFVAKGCS